MVWPVVVVIVVLVVGAAVAGMYNSLVRARHSFQNAYAQIDVQFTRRHDLIPNLVETAKAYMRHEQATLAAVTNARAAAVQAGQGAGPDDPQAMAARARTENTLTGSAEIELLRTVCALPHCPLPPLADARGEQVTPDARPVTQ